MKMPEDHTMQVPHLKSLDLKGAELWMGFNLWGWTVVHLIISRGTLTWQFFILTECVSLSVIYFQYSGSDRDFALSCVMDVFNIMYIYILHPTLFLSILEIRLCSAIFHLKKVYCFISLVQKSWFQGTLVSSKISIPKCIQGSVTLMRAQHIQL